MQSGENEAAHSADLRLDGNAVASLLEEAFAVEMTASPSTCASCGRVGAIGTLLAYTQAPGAVLRGPACEAVVLRLVRTPEAIYSDARGALALRVERRLS